MNGQQFGRFCFVRIAKGNLTVHPNTLSNPRRSVWPVFSFLLFLLILLLAGFAAVQQAAVLRDANMDIQTQTKPFSRGLVELQSNLSALGVSDHALRLQADNSEADSAELIRAHGYMAQIFSEVITLSALRLGDVQRSTFFALQNSVSRLMREQDEFRTLLNTSKFGQAVESYDRDLAPRIVDVSKEVSDFIALNRRWQQDSLEQTLAAYTATYWLIMLCLALAIAASFLLVGWHLRRFLQPPSARAQHPLIQ